jgi:SAM-dependent methyltransferase
MEETGELAGPTLGEYVIGVEGLALLRLAFTDDARARAVRTTEVRELVDRLGVEPRLGVPIGSEYDLEDGYRLWSSTYDRPLRLFAIEEPPMQALIGATPRGAALDAACGTGRYSAYLARRGHKVIGVDQLESMLAIAREKLPSATFQQGELAALPLRDGSVDSVVCALALVHIADLSSAMREFARVLRPGGRAIISDVHPFLVLLAWQAQFPAENGQTGFMRLHPHLPSDYISAAHAAGMRLRSLAEPPLTDEAVITPAAAVVPDANRAAYVGSLP